MEICSGVTGLDYSLFICRRTGYCVKICPHSVPHVVLGTCLLWFGWLGLNGSRSGTANVRAGLVMVETHLAACAGGLTWLIMDFRLKGKWSLFSYCMGAILGLVAVTPSARLIGKSASVLIGAIGAAVANTSVAFQSRLPWDDGLDIFVSHAMSGTVGVMLTGIFAQKSITQLDESRQQLVNAGSISILVSLLLSPDTDVQYYCTSALSNIAVDATNRKRLAQGKPKLVHHLIGLMDSASLKVQCQAALALRNLESDEKNKEAIVEAGVIEQIKELVLSVPLSIQSKMTACVAVLGLSKDIKGQLLDLGILEVLIPLINSVSVEAQGNSAAAIGNLSSKGKEVF
ncbi:ammonium transporter AmtB-like domain-containing protein [Phakopsora pachyrhizi]|nr:ammonium transporter AmtB-like domain-containing protein [Phakopsora pachyrhizi]